jgi:hypothetical protein
MNAATVFDSELDAGLFESTPNRQIVGGRQRGLILHQLCTMLWITPFNEGLGLIVCRQPSAAMNHPKNIVDRRTVSLAAIVTTVAASRILVAGPVHPSTARLPHGFERADIIILDWIIGASAAHRPLSLAN